jgi:dihydrofolate synthase/folylpolyglutamate synthase
MSIKTFGDIESFLKHQIIPHSGLFAGSFGLERAKCFLKILGNPQNKLKVIHIAGTSGKGSTATLTSQLLISQGFKTGLHLSPHIADIRERFQINNQLPDKKMVIGYFEQILPAIKRMEKSRFGSPTYFEIIVGLSFYIFFKEKVNYAIIETGLGGLYDGTNCVNNKNKIVILTKIGIDHAQILGKKIADIALQKASIIHPRNQIISIQQYLSAQKVIEKIAKKNNAPILWIKPKENFILRNQSSSGIILDVKLGQSFKKIELSMQGIHQAENCTLAIAGLILCAKRDGFTIKEQNMRKALASASLIGRMQTIIVGKKTIILDGAHNPQKMASLIKSLKNIYPKQKLSFIVAFKKNKRYAPMLKKIMPVAKNIIVTDFSSNQENSSRSVNTSIVANFLKVQKFLNYSIVKNSPKNILQAIRKCKNPIVITGSFYLIASVYFYFLDRSR